jgi:hypothetical protein
VLGAVGFGQGRRRVARSRFSRAFEVDDVAHFAS